LIFTKALEERDKEHLKNKTTNSMCTNRRRQKKAKDYGQPSPANQQLQVETGRTEGETKRESNNPVERKP
jgi:hypothetical protein